MSETAIDMSFLSGSALAVDGMVKSPPRSSSFEIFSALSNPRSITSRP
jgi:hypothetical protein